MPTCHRHSQPAAKILRELACRALHSSRCWHPQQHKVPGAPGTFDAPSALRHDKLQDLAHHIIAEVLYARAKFLRRYIPSAPLRRVLHGNSDSEHSRCAAAADQAVPLGLSTLLRILVARCFLCSAILDNVNKALLMHSQRKRGQITTTCSCSKQQRQAELLLVAKCVLPMSQTRKVGQAITPAVSRRSPTFPRHSWNLGQAISQHLQCSRVFA